MFRPTPVTPCTTSPPMLDRRNSDPCRAYTGMLPASASSLLARVVSIATRQPRQMSTTVVTARSESPSPSTTTSTFSDDKIEWETLSRRGSDPSQCGYFSFPDFDRLTSMSGCSSGHDESSA
ncbi:hypothetical protein ANO11243_047730 [Dothideomycetidae sp. 11243]|nr:hypothetical protein ANO11243_047730 [fungal sp. No.11243]